MGFLRLGVLPEGEHPLPQVYAPPRRTVNARPASARPVSARSVSARPVSARSVSARSGYSCGRFRNPDRLRGSCPVSPWMSGETPAISPAAMAV
jgi:hypothetical protein